jgi:hypothetical protein
MKQTIKNSILLGGMDTGETSPPPDLPEPGSSPDQGSGSGNPLLD